MKIEEIMHYFICFLITANIEPKNRMEESGASGRP